MKKDMTHNQVVPGSSPGGPTSKTLATAGVFSFMDVGCYILFSKSLKKHYIGACRSSLKLNMHATQTMKAFDVHKIS